MAEGDNQAAIQAVSLKLPTFWPKQAKVWFSQAESAFALRNIVADDTKYHHVVSVLDQDTALRVSDLLCSPPAANKFNALKDRLLGAFSLSEYERAGRILHMPDLGDDKPSHFLDQMLSYLGSDHAPCFLFRQVFLERLPEDIRAVLLHTKTEDIRALAETADQMWEAHRNATSAVHKQKVPPRQKVPSEQKSDSSLCYFHNKFGDKARKCESPCSFPTAGNGQAGRQ